MSPFVVMERRMTLSSAMTATKIMEMDAVQIVRSRRIGHAQAVHL